MHRKKTSSLAGKAAPISGEASGPVAARGHATARLPMLPPEAVNADITVLPMRENSWS